MDAFVSTLADAHLREVLETAISGKGAFRRFKDVLQGYPKDRDRWFKFKEARELEYVRRWLASNDIEPILPEAGNGGSPGKARSK